VLADDSADRQPGHPHQNILYLCVMGQKLSSYFAEVSDPRVVGRCDHLLSDLLLISICTYVTGGTDYQDMYLFGKERGEQLKGTLLELPNGYASADTYERLFNSLDSEALESCLVKYGKDILSGLAEKQIVLDGKKLKGVSPSSKGNSGCYILSAWVSENRICVGQQKVRDKSNEITAIPEVLKSLDIEEAVVSIDAMGTQTDIAHQIRDQKGHYLLCVKGNQKSLLEAVESAFKTHTGHDCTEDVTGDHGRIETRRCAVLPAGEYLLEENLKAWKDLKTLVKVESCREIKGTCSHETRYYISSEEVKSAAYYQCLVRGHWSIENQLHWHLDVTFKEDACRARTGNAPQNLTVVRKFALQIITGAKDKLSLKKRQYKAALDFDYMKKLLEF
jgi:predicted transposase YbfD/YdcC